jgi:hypothetical protein
MFVTVSYIFEGRELTSDIVTGMRVEYLDVLAGLVISYKLLSKDRVTKAAKAQDAFIRGYLYGLETSGIIDSTENDKVYKFFMNQE